MKKCKNYIIFVCTCLLIVLCGMFPILAAKVQDSFSNNKMYYEQKNTLQFSRNLNDIQKLYLLGQGTMVEIAEDRAHLKSEHMKEILEPVLQPYYAMMYVQGELSDFTVQSVPLLYYSNTESNFSSIFWRIQMESVGDMEQNLYLYIDDASGKILTISYECEGAIYAKKGLDSRLFNLFDFYKSSLEWNMEGESIQESGDVNFEADVELGNGYDKNYREETRWHVNCEGYGEVELIFIMTEYGFKIGVND